MRVCGVCNSVYRDDVEECKECKDGGELITCGSKDNTGDGK